MGAARPAPCDRLSPVSRRRLRRCAVLLRPDPHTVQLAPRSPAGSGMPRSPACASPRQVSRHSPCCESCQAAPPTYRSSTAARRGRRLCRRLSAWVSAGCLAAPAAAQQPAPAPRAPALGRRLRLRCGGLRWRRDRFIAIPIQDDCLHLLLGLSWQHHGLGDDFVVTGRAVQEDRDDKHREQDKYNGADNAFFQCSFHHDWGREYSSSCASTGPTT